ncbi:hypothetical protein KY386_00810 [Candidatus Parcubacteria bacterium]|nr:hypothetical protein [Candidatus Parcubacteria bacterium]
MQITPNLDVTSDARILDLIDILGLRVDLWPGDVIQGAAENAALICEIVGRPALPLLPDDRLFAELAALGSEQLERIWSVLPCPWCGINGDHLQACPLMAAESEFRTALNVWQYGMSNSRHCPGIKPGQRAYEPAIKFKRFYDLGWDRGQMTQRPAVHP